MGLVLAWFGTFVYMMQVYTLCLYILDVYMHDTLFYMPFTRIMRRYLCIGIYVNMHTKRCIYIMAYLSQGLSIHIRIYKCIYSCGRKYCIF